MASKHRLRRSCAFCRARKIKCSNETICEACRRQGADCIYDFEPPRPKARSSLDSSRSDTASIRNGDFAPLMGRQRSNTCSSMKGSPAPSLVEEPMMMGENEDIASALERSFLESFSAAGMCRSHNGRRRHHHQPKNINKEGILPLLTQDLVGLSTSLVGSLGSRHVEEGGAQFFLSGIEADDTTAMFDGPAPETNPVTEYAQRQQTQLIDVWYSSHPLSFLVSKTLLLRELRDGTHDEVLLATMLADANFTIGGEPATSRGNALLQWAGAQLRYRSTQIAQSTGLVTDSGTVVYSGISTRIFSGISTAQALMLLGWTAMRSGQFRRAFSYIRLAGKMAHSLKDQVTSTDGMQLSSRINGIDVCDVEKELIDYLYWTTYALSLWIFLQSGCSSFTAPATPTLTSILIPASEETSSAIQLDLVSENINTIQQQRSVINQMRPLAHLAIAVAHTCGLHPGQSAQPSSNPLQRCRATDAFLMEGIQALSKSKDAGAATGSLVLVLYHTLAMQFLFPGAGDGPVTAEVAERLCFSMDEVLRLFGRVAGGGFGAMSSLPSAFGLALDTSARAIRIVEAKRRAGQAVLDFASSQAYGQRLQGVATRLYNLSKDDLLDQRSSLRATRKLLKASARDVGATAGRHSPGPDATGAEGSGPMSSAGSDQLSVVSTPEMEPHTTFVSPRETTAIPSPEAPATPNNATSMFQPPPTAGIKHEWQAAGGMAMPATSGADEDDMFGNPLDPNVLGIQSRADLSLQGMVDLQHTWLPQMPPLSGYDMMGMHQWQQWPEQQVKGGDGTVPPTAVWSDLDMVL